MPKDLQTLACLPLLVVETCLGRLLRLLELGNGAEGEV